LRAFLRHSFTEIVDDPLWPLQLLLTTYDDPRARAAVRGFYERTAELLVPQLEQICDAWNRKARAPFDIQTFEIIVTAVVEGLALRKLIQPELVPDSLSSDVILALTTTFLADRDDSTTLDDVVSEIDGYGAAS
jgi:hypothetical protein